MHARELSAKTGRDSATLATKAPNLGGSHALACLEES
eukprot:CAMPEP_0179202656 /NCGR_PEP_ID=MMETSP0796-20121207/100950_1 /TAXON_ID=73915 /ORGANISM="Pyrodinium bahamense, Strain pbaha01" /LENGTH=36 /DNA_ID= /DNA_START= /DNA_END= /DNA_ORIENTATION=